MASRGWTCRRCGALQQPRWRNCRSVGCDGRKPKKPVRAVNKTLRDDSYAVYVQVARDIHGVTDESCCVCGKPRSQERRHDRDHDHVTGKPRGLACGGNSGCNVLMTRFITPAVAHAIYLDQPLDSPSEERWRAIRNYLLRVAEFYRDEEQAA